MTRYPGMLLPTLTQPRDTTETRKALLDLLKKVNLVDGDLQELEAEFDSLLAAYLVLIGRIAYTDVANVFTQNQTIEIDGSFADLFLRAYRNTGNRGIVEANAARGTKASPSFLQANDRIFAILARSWNGTGFSTDSGLVAFAQENQSATARGSYLAFYTARNGNTSATAKLFLTGDGRLYGTDLHNNSGAVTGATNQYIASGTYTPTLFNTTNVDASTAFSSQWMRVGNVVSVSGRVSVDLTTTLTVSVLGMSLPIASNFTALEQCGGTAYNQSTDAGWAIMADSTNDRAIFNNAAIVATVSSTYHYTFTYLIL